MIPGITTTELIYESENSLVYRGIRDHSQQPLILKLLKQDYPTVEKITQYKQEYKLTSALNAPNIIQAYGLERYQRTYVILLEDFGGISLRQLMAAKLTKGKPFTLLECLNIFIQITESVEAIHRADVIHKDINPSNIVFNVETNQLKMIDFGLATVLPKESPLLESPSHLQGTLTHISPEQTGRMNRAVDYRTDFYSLGVTFYELLTHQLPFPSNDPMALIHCHIAKYSQPPHHLNSAIPVPLSDLVMRLLAKNPEDRYQSTWGIKWDLENCREQWAANQKISSFAVGSHDIKDRFQIPQKLYGRGTSVNSLLTTFDRISQAVLPKSELLLITGHSGIGKSSLVNEIYKPLTNCPGLFIEGKFEQLNANTPYSAIIQAFQSLVQQLLSEEDNKLAHWRSALTKALAANAQVIVEVIPALSNILGDALPSPPALPPDEAQNRFNLVFQKFIQVFARPEHPLVIFLDDLQWADRASLKIIQNLLTVSGPQSLLLIGAYRDNEVSATHPLTGTLEAIEEGNTPIHRIQLLPLNVVDIQALLSDTFVCSEAQSKPLAALVLSKTNGNPFFINEFLGFLYREQLIYFDSQRSLNQWQWDLSEIRKQSFTDNVIDLIVSRVEKLSSPSQETLKIAACIGHEFDLASLASVQAHSLKNIADWLSEAMASSFILPLNDNYKSVELEVSQSSEPSEIQYKFSHDRIQDALYSLVSLAEKSKIHQKVGEHLLAKSDSPEMKEKGIFDIVYHLNLGREAVTDPSQYHQLAELNLMAGKKSKKAAAYALAFDYLNTGVSMLPENCWQHNYELTLAMYTETAEAAYLNLELEKMEALTHTILEQSEDRIEKARTDLIRIRGYLAKNDLLSVIKIALKALKGLGVNLPQKPTQKDVFASVIKSRLFLASTSVEKLAQLPEIGEPRVIAALDIFSNLFVSAYLSNPKLYVITIAEAFVLLVKYGNTASASTVYASYGQILCNLLGDVENGFKLGDLAVKVSKLAGSNRYQAFTYHIVYGYLRHWKVPLQASLEPLLESYAIGKETGNLYIGAGSAFLYCLYSYCVGKDLAKLEQELASYRSEIERLGQAPIVNYQAICQQAVLNLRGQSEDVCSLIGEAYNKEDMLPIHQEASDLPAIYNVYLHQLVLSYLFRDYDQARANSVDAQQYIEALLGSPLFSLFYFYDSLSQLALGLSQPQKDQKEIFKKVRLNQKKLKRWAKYSPENYQHRYYLVEAECAQLKGQSSRAKEFYGQAIALAHQHDYLHEEALASERAALFYLKTAADQRLGAYYLRDAYYGYKIWGAIAKVKQLEDLYPELLGSQSQNAERPMTISMTTSNDRQGSSKQLDFDSLLRVSRAISEEIILDKLITALMKTVLENAGAQKGFLLLETSGEWRIESSSAVNASNVRLDVSDVPNSFPLTDSERPVLSRSIVNYVIRTKENIVIDDAANRGRFIRDPYVVEHQPQSILCTPLLNQGNLTGIIYLENNLTTEAFTPQRIELLKIICSQAAISIENARLYEKLKDYSYTLEQSVEERTKELSQTLNVLKATQAELIFENDLLKGSEDVKMFSYQVGGSLPMDSPAYVVRAADKAFHKALRKGEFCYILNTRQMGKSSLMVRMMNYLRKEDVCCAAIDMTQIGSETVTVEQWYKGLAVELWRSFNLRKSVKLRDWWNVRKDLSPVQRLSQFIEEVVLAHVGVGQTDDQTPARQIVVFIDEIDSVLGLKIPVDDFFRLIRSCYNQRTVKPEYGRLTFAFFGVATPSMLMRDRTKTPFNIGQSIQLKGFKEHEAQPLLYGLSEKVANPQVLLKEILAWTGGQPFLTQRLCKLIRDTAEPIPTNEEAGWVETLVQEKIIENWESQDEPEHLRTIRDRLLYGEQSATQLLTLYRQILLSNDEKGIAVVDSPVENELLLTGLVINQQGVLIVHNRAYRLIFNLSWVESQLAVQLEKQTERLLEAPLAGQ